jgi:sortase A
VRVRPGSVRSAFLAFTANLLVLAGIAGVLVSVWALADGALYQHVQEIQFEREVGAGGGFGDETGRVVPEAAPAPARFAPVLVLMSRDPQLLGRLEVPSIGLAVMVREGVDEASLRKALGHLPSSALPGGHGNVVLLGHRDTFFRPLRSIARGEAIHMRTARGSFAYAVESVEVVSPESALNRPPAADSALTLITCFPFSYGGPAPRRFVVRARLISEGENVP